MVKYFFKRAAMLMALAAVVIASGCKQTVNTETVNTGTTAVAVTGIKLNKGDLSLKVDESKKLAATVMPANATNKQVTWASDKPAVATVSQDGTVTAKEEGTAQITVKTVNGGKIARCKITVTAKDPTPTAEFTVEVTHVGHGTISANPAIPASRKIAKDTSITFTAESEEGYKVDKWSITPHSVLIDGGTDGSKSAKVKITANTTVKVSFKKISYKVTFDAKGGLPVPPAQHVLYKEKASAPTVPAKEGYDLEGWFNKDGDAPWDFTVNEVTKDTNLYAKWKTKKYAVNFNVDGSNGTLKAKLDGKPFTGGDINFGKTVIFTAEPDEGYAVEQWTLNGTEAPASAISTTYQCSVTAETEVRVRFIQKEEAGLIVLSNGLFKRRDNYTTIDSQNPPVAVICGTNGYGAATGIALHSSGSTFKWAKDGSTGNNTKFVGIICKPSELGHGTVETATFTGDTDGSDNWAYICSIDPNGTVNAAENYPAFNWVNTYNETYKTKLGGKTFAWYMPSLKELCDVYKNSGAINASLQKIRELDSSYTDGHLDMMSLYWSSSQCSEVSKLAWIVSFVAVGAVDGRLKNHYGSVCCIAVF